MSIRPIAFACFVGALVAACGGVSSSNGDGGLPNLQPPTLHRPAPLTCTHDRAVGVASDGGPAGDAGFPGGCTTDAECTTGTNGRCLRPGGNAAGRICSYDDCFTDSDCMAGSVCECGSVPTMGMRVAANRCVKGNCTKDGDCGANGFCSPSSSPGGCSGLQVDGYYCHTPNDRCSNDSDCGTSSLMRCSFDMTQAHWACLMVTICNG